jgi:hypothetical protein
MDAQAFLNQPEVGFFSDALYAVTLDVLGHSLSRNFLLAESMKLRRVPAGRAVAPAHVRRGPAEANWF